MNCDSKPDIHRDLTSREIWLKQRVVNLLYDLSKLEELRDWIEFKNQAHELAVELLYATTEWDKYYRGKVE